MQNIEFIATRVASTAKLIAQIPIQDKRAVGDKVSDQLQSARRELLEGLAISLPTDRQDVAELIVFLMANPSRQTPAARKDP